MGEKSVLEVKITCDCRLLYFKDFIEMKGEYLYLMKNIFPIDLVKTMLS